jgi:hypothetical protein
VGDSTGPQVVRRDDQIDPRLSSAHEARLDSETLMKWDPARGCGFGRSRGRFLSGAGLL